MEKQNTSRILIVDDEEDLAEVTAESLKRKGYDVTAVFSGSDAFKLIQSQKFDLIISDMRMPDMSGLDLALKIKSEIPNPPPIIFITGFSEIALEKAYDVGVLAVFPKPHDRKMLDGLIKKVMVRSQHQHIRKHERFNLDSTPVLTAKATWGEQDCNKEAKMLQNVGLGGVFLAFDGELPPLGQKIRLQIACERRSMLLIEATATVRWVKESADAITPRGFGVAFEDLPGNNRARLIDLVNTIVTLPNDSQ